MADETNKEITEEVTEPVSEPAPKKRGRSRSETAEPAASTKPVTIARKLLNIQSSLKSPKNFFNKSGRFYYRSTENILESLKPHLVSEGVALILEDAIVERCGVPYVKATATMIDVDTGEKISTSAYARECLHKGMYPDQCTGTASSFARKYALNAMFLFDDGKDADSTEMKDIENATFVKPMEREVPNFENTAKAETPKVETPKVEAPKPVSKPEPSKPIMNPPETKAEPTKVSRFASMKIPKMPSSNQ